MATVGKLALPGDVVGRVAAGDEVAVPTTRIGPGLRHIITPTHPDTLDVRGLRGSCGHSDVTMCRLLQ